MALRLEWLTYASLPVDISAQGSDMSTFESLAPVTRYTLSLESTGNFAINSMEPQFHTPYIKL